MAKIRQCKVYVAAGFRGAGKTVATIEMLDKIVMGNAANGIPPRKCLILDTNDEFGDFWFYDNPHRKIKALAMKDLERFTVSPFCEIRRIRPFLENGDPMSLDDLAATLMDILKIYRCGALLCEDPTVFLTESMPGDLIGKLSVIRHLGLDLILHFQSIGKCFTPKIFANTSYIRLHKTNDSVMRHESKILDKAPLFTIAENLVNHKYFEEKQERFYVIIDNDRSKIRAGKIPFTDEDVERAIQEYIALNRTQLVKPYKLKIDLVSGKKAYADDRAILQAVSNKLRQTYFE